MTQRVGDRSRALPPQAARRLVVRSLLISVALVVLYYRLPMTGALDASGTALLVVGLVVLVVLIVWQVRAILRSPYPGLRAIEALAGVIPLFPLFLLLFAAAYVLLANAQPQAFTEPLTKTSALYFTVTVFATVGFGDIVPKSDAARVVTTVQMLGDLVVLGLVVRVILGAARVGRHQRSADPDAAEPSTRHEPG
jgi:voltage-gated potassium channel